METKKWKPVNTKAIINNLNLVFKTRDIDKLNGPTYNYLYLLSGFIAHYDINGFKHYYQDLRELIKDLSDSHDIAYPRVECSSDCLQIDYYNSKYETHLEVKKLVEKYEKEIWEIFCRLEQEQDLNTIKLLMRKNNLQEVTQ